MFYVAVLDAAVTIETASIDSDPDLRMSKKWEEMKVVGSRFRVGGWSQLAF